jgi:hypothetical protein
MKGFAEPVHPTFLECLVSLFGIARLTSRYNILPVCYPSPGAGDDMINGQPPSVFPTVLACKVISAENVFLAENYFPLARYANESLQANDTWKRERKAVGVDQKAILLDCFGTAAEDHPNSAAPRTDLERLVAPV